MKYSIGIDIGTTTVKCILFGEGVQVVAEAGREYKTLLPKASWAQQNPEDWWKGVAESIRSILTESRVAPEDIKVISVSSQAPAVLPMTKEGEPLHDALIWMDRRSTKELEILEENINDDPESMDFYCDVIIDEASKMNKLVKNLLTLNQLESGKDAAVMERFDLTALIKGVLSTMDIMIRQAERSPGDL